jgi:hypothetical protein
MTDPWPEFDEASVAAPPPEKSLAPAPVTSTSASTTIINSEVRGHEIFTGHIYTGAWDQHRKLPEGHGRCVFRSERGESGGDGHVYEVGNVYEYTGTQ